MTHLNSIKHKIKLSYETYLEGLLGLNDENAVCNTKKLSSFLKGSKQDRLGSETLNHRQRLITNTAEMADTQGGGVL